jgi:hypothetical protein
VDSAFDVQVYVQGLWGGDRQGVCPGPHMGRARVPLNARSPPIPGRKWELWALLNSEENLEGNELSR